jgi:HEAT repeat protein
VTEPTGRPAKPPRTWRPMALWTHMISKLGGKEAASHRLGIYLALPRAAYDEELRYFAVRLAACCGNPTLRLLVKELELQANDSRTRTTAAYGLRKIGPEATTVVPAPEKALADEDEPVRKAAASALDRIRLEEPKR